MTIIKNSSHLPVNRENILALIDEKSIYDFYIGYNAAIGTPIKSPLKEVDENPSFNLFYTANGDLKFMDFSLQKHGNVFDFVQQLPQHKGQIDTLWEACLKINQDLKLGLGNGHITLQNGPKVVLPEMPKTKNNYRIKIQSFTEKDLQYWGTFGICESTLKKFRVLSVEILYKNGIEYARYSPTNLMYAYYFPKIDGFKLYRPLESKPNKWLQQTHGAEIIQGIDQLPENGEVLIITKALKDVMVLHDLGFSAIAPMSEGQNISSQVIKEMESRFKHILTIFDNDAAGVNAASRLRLTHNIPFFLLPYSYHIAKDISEGVIYYGKTEVKQDIINIINTHVRHTKEDKNQLLLPLSEGEN